MSNVQDVLALIERIRPILAGQKPEVIGAALAQLTSTWIAGHHVQGDAKETDKTRDDILAMQVKAIKALVILEDTVNRAMETKP